MFSRSKRADGSAESAGLWMASVSQGQLITSKRFHQMFSDYTLDLCTRFSLLGLLVLGLIHDSHQAGLIH